MPKEQTERRLFLTVSGLGVCDENGRNSSIQFSYKRRLGDKRKPMSTLFIPLLDEAFEICRWPSEECKIDDLELLAKYLAEILQSEKDQVDARA